MRRLSWEALLAAGLSAGPLAAQSPDRWALSLGLEGVRFGEGARDTISEPAAAVHVRPSGRLGGSLGLHRGVGRWAVGVVLGFAQGNVEAANDAVLIRDRTADLSRYRAGLAVERRVARLGAGRLSLGIEPTLDLWSLNGETRTRAGVQGGIILRLPLGRLELEQRLAAGLSASPLRPADLGGGFELRTLRMVGLGLGVRMPL